MTNRNAAQYSKFKKERTLPAIDLENGAKNQRKKNLQQSFGKLIFLYSVGTFRKFQNLRDYIFFLHAVISKHCRVV